jgi:multiple sugar transport system substrate-binding protein
VGLDGWDGSILCGTRPVWCQRRGSIAFMCENPLEYLMTRIVPLGELLLKALLASLIGLSVVPLAGQSALAQESSTVTFAFWGDPAEEIAYDEVIAGFEAQNPAIDVKAIYTPGKGDYQTKLSTSFAAGQPPDVFLINYRHFGQYAARGALHPVEPLLRQSQTLQEEDFYEQPLEAFRYRGGELTCLPQNISSLVVYYNRDLFDANGVPLPESGWTWDDFVSAAEALTYDRDGDHVNEVYGVAVDPSFIRYAPFIWGAGGNIVDDVENPTTLALDTPEARAGIEAFISLGYTEHAVVPNESEALAEDDESRFMRGGAAMLLQSRRVVPTLREIDDFTWDVAPLPEGPAGPATVLHSDAFCLAADAADKEAAWRFIEYAAGVEGQTTLAYTGRTVPSLRSVAESGAFLKGTRLSGQIGIALPPQHAQIFIDTIPTIRRVPSISTWPEVEEAFNSAFKRAFYVEIDIDGAIDVATHRSRDAFERAAKEDG